MVGQLQPVAFSWSRSGRAVEVLRQEQVLRLPLRHRHLTDLRHLTAIGPATWASVRTPDTVHPCDRTGPCFAHLVPPVWRAYLVLHQILPSVLLVPCT